MADPQCSRKASRSLPSNFEIAISQELRHARAFVNDILVAVKSAEQLYKISVIPRVTITPVTFSVYSADVHYFDFALVAAYSLTVSIKIRVHSLSTERHQYLIRCPISSGTPRNLMRHTRVVSPT